jgi:hypothetical protein
MDTFVDGCFVHRSYAATAGIHNGGILTNFIGSTTGLASFYGGVIYFARTYANYLMTPFDVSMQYNGGRFNIPLNIPAHNGNCFVDCGLLQDVSGNTGRIYTLTNGAYLEGIPY